MKLDTILKAKKDVKKGFSGSTMLSEAQSHSTQKVNLLGKERKQSFFLFVWCSGELEACSLSGPHVCLPLSTRQWVLKNWSFQVTFL